MKSWFFEDVGSFDIADGHGAPITTGEVSLMAGIYKPLRKEKWERHKFH